MATLNQAKIIKSLEKITEDLDKKTFFFDFLKAYGFPKTTIQRLQKNDSSRNIALEPGDYGLTKQIYFHPLDHGHLSKALKELINNDELKKQRVRFFIVTDFHDLVAYDARVDDYIEIDFKDLRCNFDFFLPLTGQYEKPLEYSEHPADIKACEKMGRLYDVIRVLNHYEKSDLHDLNVFLTRLLFCLFAEDTGIFPKKGQMTSAIESMTSRDGKELRHFFEQLFEILDIPEKSKKRDSYPATLQAFPYVDGGLFSEHTRVPQFNTRGRNLLLECCRLEWKEVSPVIFGSMFQAVVDPEKRHEFGAHYTSEKNIFKLIRPLFLDDLEKELQQILDLKSNKEKRRRLNDYQTRLSTFKFLDPACGCGNFLIVSYRELKTLELRALKARLDLSPDKSRSIFMDWGDDSRVSIDQFYGIELEEFPVEIARVSMWLMEHFMNVKFGAELGRVFPSIPLKKSVNIICANALEIDWNDLIKAKKLSYIMGNPPFSGARSMKKIQKKEVEATFDGMENSSNLDYVCAWYKKASDLLEINNNIQCAFVSTNSICQGEQVDPLWGYLFNKGITINFAHQTFRWKNEARDNAGVYCIIVGFSKTPLKNKKLYVYDDVNDEPTMSVVGNINAYLVDSSSDLIVKSSSTVLSPRPAMVFGNQPIDGGNLLIEADEVKDFIDDDEIRKYVKKLVGAKELIYNTQRYCLWLVNAPEKILQDNKIKERLRKCKEYRLSRKRPATRARAATPQLFHDRRFDIPPEMSIVIPRVSGEKRFYIPIGFVGSESIVTDTCNLIPNGTLFDFGILESRMHMTWMRAVCGRLESRYRYSRDLCYNTFPLPETNESQRKIISNLAQNVLDIRERYPEKTLADLYDIALMPNDLKKAHQELDGAVDKLYRKKSFENDEQRLHHLFARYEKLIQGEDDSQLFDEDL
ncbi:MAG: putative DNA methyltransferase YeeA [Burkholderia sp.]|jgi:hypothetical protein